MLVQAASLDAPGRHRPALDVHCSRAWPWQQLDPALQKFAQMPPLPDLPLLRIHAAEPG